MKKSAILTLALLFLASPTLAFEFCSDGEQSEDELRIISVDDMLKENSREWVWQAAQKIELEIRVENKDYDSGDYIIEAVFKDGDKTEKIVTDSDELEKEFSLSKNQRESVSLTFELDDDIDPSEYDLYVKFHKKSDEDEACVENSEEKIEIEKIEICPSSEVDDDELKISKIRDEEEDNEEKWEWAPGNNIEISLSLTNKDYSKRDFTVDLIFINEEGKEVSLATESSEVTDGAKIDEDEEEDFNFNFKLKSEIPEGKYSLYAKAYDSEDEDTCISLKAEDKSKPQSISINRAERKVIVTSVQGPTSAPTSSIQEYTATIANLGSKDEDKVLLIAYNRQLNIKEKIEITNLKSGEEKTMTVSVDIPSNATLQRYNIEFSTEYEYNKKQDYYREASSEDDDIKYALSVTKGKDEPKEETIKINKTENNSNSQIIKEELPKEENPPTTVITGNVIGTNSSSPSWTIIAGLIVIAIVGIILFFKKPKKIAKEVVEVPKVIRRYTAKLDWQF